MTDSDLGRRIRLPNINAWRALPLLALIVVTFDFSLAALLGRSVFTDSGFTLSYFREAWATPAYMRIFSDTFRVSAVATVLCALMGYPLAYWMRGLSARHRGIVLGLVLMTFWISILVRTYAWIVVLGNAGLVNRTLQWFSLIQAPLELLYSELGVTIGMTNVLLPFLVLPLLAAMMRIDERLMQAATSLGASQSEVFWRIFFPLTLPALSSSMLLLFMLSLGFYVTPAILGGGKVPLLGNLLDSLINETSQWELAAAISALLLVFALIIFWFYNRLEKRAGSNT